MEEDTCKEAWQKVLSSQDLVNRGLEIIKSMFESLMAEVESGQVSSDQIRERLSVIKGYENALQPYCKGIRKETEILKSIVEKAVQKHKK